MENENPQEGSPRRQPTQKVAKKKNKQATVLKQLNNQNLYPIQERIGIYIIAVLSTIGLALITYTGVMAIVSSTANGSDAPIDIDVGDLHDMLEELDELDNLTETEEPTQATEDLHHYVDPTETETETEIPPTEEPTDETEPDETEEPTEELTEEPNNNTGPDGTETDETETPPHEPFTGVINQNRVSVWRNPASDALFLLNEGDEITVLELNYNAYWSRIEVEDDRFSAVPIARFVRTVFIDHDHE